MTRTVQIRIGDVLADLIEPDLVRLRSTEGLAVVLSAPQPDVREAIRSIPNIHLLEIPARTTVPAEIGRFRQRWATVDVDAIAPRLRTVQLPSGIVHAHQVISLADTRDDTRARPDLVIGMWARLASPRLSFGARLTGPRDGLTAEIALARPPHEVFSIDSLWIGGPLIAVHSDDLIAVEVVALSVRDLRTTRAAQLGGPWEDELIQRATEVDLGVPGPEWITVHVRVSADCDSSQRQRALDAVELALARAGIATVTSQ